MKALKIEWEQEVYEIDADKEPLTPLEILQSIGERGRSAFIEILFINYREETLNLQKSIDLFIRDG